MFNLSFGEILILSAIGLLVLGPKQLPQIAKVLGRTYNEFRKAFQDVTDVMKTELRSDVLKSTKGNSISGAITKTLGGAVVGNLAESILKDEKDHLESKTAPSEGSAKNPPFEKKSIEEAMRELGKS